MMTGQMGDGPEKRGRSETRTGGREATTGVIPGRYALSVGMPSTPAPEGWRWVPLSDVARLESGHTPSRRVPEYWNGDIPWIGIRDATGNHGRTLTKTIESVAQAGIDNSSARVLPAGTVCLSRTASVGYVVMMGVPMATSQDFVNWVCSEQLDPRFLKYVLLAEHDSMHRFSSGTTHQTIYYPEAKAFHLCLPEIGEQRAIADGLSALDDKIELNRQTSATLEELAWALFKSWFVDFEPVRAKEEGCATDLPPGLAAVFPDSLVDSETKAIPVGWRSEPLGAEFKVLMGQSPPGETYNQSGDGLPFYQGSTDFGGRYPARRVYCSAPTRIADAGDTLVSVRAPVGALNSALERCAIGRGVAAILHRSGSKSYTYYLMNSLKSQFAHFEAEGTVFGSISGDAFKRLTILVPPGQVVSAFEALVAPLDARSEVCERQARSLMLTRDTLLPKLISGELRVPDAERLVTSVA